MRSDRLPPAVWIETPTVYRLYDENGHLLYVGRTMNLGSRLGSHAAPTSTSRAWWSKVAGIEMEVFATKKEAVEAEGLAIALESPLMNERIPPTGREALRELARLAS